MRGPPNQSSEQKTKEFVQRTTRILFPGSVNKTVSIEQMEQVFGKQLFGEQQTKLEKTPRKRTKTSIPSLLLSSKKSKTQSSQKQVSTTKDLRISELKRMDIQSLKDLCQTRYRIGCDEVRKKGDVISIIIEKEYPEKKKHKR